MARTIESEQWEVRQEMSIPYYEETQKRTLKQKLRKIKKKYSFPTLAPKVVCVL